MIPAWFKTGASIWKVHNLQLHFQCNVYTSLAYTLLYLLMVLNSFCSAIQVYMHHAPFVLLVNNVKLDLFLPIALFGYDTPSRCLALAGTPANYYFYYCFVCIGLLSFVSSGLLS